MSVNIGSPRLNINIRVAYPGKLGSGLPVAPPGYIFLTDDAGNYLTDDVGNYLITEAL